LWDVFWVFLGFLGGSALGGALAAVLGEISLAEDLSPVISPMAVFITTASQTLGALAVLAYLSRTRGTGSFATDFGFEVRLRDWWGLPAGMVLQIVVAVATAPLLQLLFPDGPPQQDLLDVTESSDGVLDSLLILTALVLLAPIAEELIFRGILLSRLVRSMAMWWAIGAQAALFALIHLGDPNAIAAIPGIMIIGMVLGYAAIKTGSLSVPLYLHAGVNLAAALLLLFGGAIVDWLDEMAGIEQTESLIRLLF